MHSTLFNIEHKYDVGDTLHRHDDGILTEIKIKEVTPTHYITCGGKTYFHDTVDDDKAWCLVHSDIPVVAQWLVLYDNGLMNIHYTEKQAMKATEDHAVVAIHLYQGSALHPDISLVWQRNPAKLDWDPAILYHR